MYNAKIISIGTPQAVGSDTPVIVLYYDETSGMSQQETLSLNANNAPDLTAIQAIIDARCEYLDYTERLTALLAPIIEKGTPLRTDDSIVKTTEATT